MTGLNAVYVHVPDVVKRRAFRKLFLTIGFHGPTLFHSAR